MVNILLPCLRRAMVILDSLMAMDTLMDIITIIITRMLITIITAMNLMAMLCHDLEQFSLETLLLQVGKNGIALESGPDFDTFQSSRSSTKAIALSLGPYSRCHVPHLRKHICHSSSEPRRHRRTRRIRTGRRHSQRER